MPGHCSAIALPHNPAQARRLLAEAGYPDGRNFPVLEALAWDRHYWSAMLEHLQVAWQEHVGVAIHWQQLEFGALINRLVGKVPHIWLGGWIADYPDPDSFLRSASWRAQAGWRHDVYDEWVEDARRTVDQEERMRIYRRAEAILVEDVPIVPLAYPCLCRLVKPWVRGLGIAPMGAVNYEEIIIDAH